MALMVVVMHAAAVMVMAAVVVAAAVAAAVAAVVAAAVAVVVAEAEAAAQVLDGAEPPQLTVLGYLTKLAEEGEPEPMQAPGPFVSLLLEEWSVEYDELNVVVWVSLWLFKEGVCAGSFCEPPTRGVERGVR